MQLTGEGDLVRTVADLVDFFNLVDINGDGWMEWDEFTAFIIEQVVTSRTYECNERFELLGHSQVQPTETRALVKCTLYVPTFGAILQGVGSQIQFYTPYEHEPSWTSNTYSLPLFSRKRSVGEDDPVDVLDMAYMASEAVLFILRSDLCIECTHFNSTTTLTPDNIENKGMHETYLSFSKIAVTDTPREPLRLFCVGTTHSIDVWKVQVGAGGRIELLEHQLLNRHKDYVRDVLVIRNDSYSLFVSCSMDKTVVLWDLVTLRFKALRTGHKAGVNCLAYDKKSTLLAGGFDYSIIAWDLDQSIDKPLFTLLGHQDTLGKIISISASERAFSLDIEGELRMWDTS